MSEIWTQNQAKHLHIEGPDAPKLMHMINGMCTLRITNDNGKLVDCSPATIWKTKFYNPDSAPLKCC